MSIPVRAINQAGLILIMKFEGCKLEAYKCPAGIWTIGYGHTGPDVHEGLIISQAMAERILLQDLAKFCKSVFDMVKVDVTDNQFSALVALCFNIGAGNLSKSTLIKKLNFCDYIGCAAQFDVWNKAAGKVLEGLCKRREAERLLFET